MPSVNAVNANELKNVTPHNTPDLHYHKLKNVSKTLINLHFQTSTMYVPGILPIYP